jgi:hypothetical protein
MIDIKIKDIILTNISISGIIYSEIVKADAIASALVEMRGIEPLTL